MLGMNMLHTSTGPIAVDVQGEGHPVVLLPSGAHDHHDYDELRALLPARFRSISLDWPAHGASPAGEGPASEMRFAAVAQEVVAALAPEGAVVLGNSVGGFAAARIAISAPELVKGLVIVDGGGFEGSSPQSRLFCALMGRPWFLRRIYPPFSARYMLVRTEADRRAREGAISTVGRPDGLKAVSELWASFAADEHDLRGLAAQISAPTLVLWGRHDPVLPLKAGRWIQQAIPGAGMVEFDSGHVPHTTDPAGVAAALVPFADAVFASAGAATVPAA